MPEIFAATLGACARPAICFFQASMPSRLRSAGRPEWSRMIWVSGKLRARSTASCRCHQGVWRSKRRPSGFSRAKPSRQSGSIMLPGRPSRGEALARGFWRTPRTKGNWAWRSSTGATSARSSQAWATATSGEPVSLRSSAMNSISPMGSLRIPFRLEIDGLDDVVAMAAGIGQMLGGIIRPADGGIITVAEGDHRLVVEPGVVVLGGVPEMDMGVHHREVGCRGVGCHALRRLLRERSLRTFTISSEAISLDLARQQFR